MVVFAVHLHQRSLRVRADVGEDAAVDVDRVGAINILRAGHARCACEVSDADRQQLEPAEATQEQLRAA